MLQKSAFLASTDGIELSIHFNKKLGAGFFGGEGFIMQRLSGSGMAFVEIDGELVEYTLEPGQKLIVDTGNVAGFDTTRRPSTFSRFPASRTSCSAAKACSILR